MNLFTQTTFIIPSAFNPTKPSSGARMAKARLDQRTKWTCELRTDHISVLAPEDGLVGLRVST